MAELSPELTEQIEPCFTRLRQALQGLMLERELLLSNAEIMGLTLLAPNLLVIGADWELDTVEDAALQEAAELMANHLDTIGYFDEAVGAEPVRRRKESEALLQRELLHMANHFSKYEHYLTDALRVLVTYRELVEGFFNAKMGAEGYDLKASIREQLEQTQAGNMGDDETEQIQIDRLLATLGF